MRTVILCAGIALFVAAAGRASISTKAYLTTVQMQNVVETRGVNFSGFTHLNGYHVNVDVAKCLGLRRLGVLTVAGKSVFFGFKCQVTTNDESIYTIWIHAVSKTRFAIDSAALVSSTNPRVENCITYGGDWTACVGQYRP